MDEESDPRGELVYAEAIRALDQQVASLADIRDRAGILLSAASIATSFFAALVIRKGEGLMVLAGFAIAAFLFVVAVCVTLLAPRGHWAFRFEVSALVKNCLEAKPPPSLARMHHDLSKQMDESANENEAKLNRMLKWFRWAGVGLGIEVAFWIADLIWRR